MKVGNPLIGAALALLLVLATAQDDSGLPGVETQVGECLYCNVGVVHVMMADRVPTSTYRCITDETQEGDGESEMAYSINLPTAFVVANKEKLNTGVSSICIIGGSAIRTPFGKPDYIVIPPNAGIHFVTTLPNRDRHLVQTGSRSVLVVRVTAPSSTQSASSASLANATFGTGGQQYSMASQYSSCSAGKLTFVAASGYPDKVTNGVIDLLLPATVNNTNIFDLENSMITSVKASLGVSDLGNTFSNILFCMPYGTTFYAGGSKNWLAYAYVPGQYSYYNNGWCSSLSAKMHEIGHNLGLQHSNENGYSYDDQSCMMGYSYSGTGSPAMCFNGHKNYVLGWYADKQITVNPTTNGAWTGKLVGFVDYAIASSTSRNEYVLIIVDNLYIQYNLASRFNFQVQEKANMVTITTATSSTSGSSMLSALSVGQSAVISLYIIEACGMVAATSTEPTYIILSIRLTTQTSTCTTPSPTTSTPTSVPTTQPTSNPTTQPTNQPTRFPTSNPTSEPTRFPTSNPTSQPTRFPTTQPTSEPTRFPTSNPTAHPTSQPTTQPTSEPTRFPTAHPTSQPTTQPTIQPTSNPSTEPTSQPTTQPTSNPSTEPTSQPTTQPTSNPTTEPTTEPIRFPTTQPTRFPTTQPTSKPTAEPTTRPTRFPTTQPTSKPSAEPTTRPTRFPTTQPTRVPTNQPTSKPTAEPTTRPTRFPTTPPTRKPTAEPTTRPTRFPTTPPTRKPTAEPTTRPTRFPTTPPTRKPTAEPTTRPTQFPTTPPTSKPTPQPTINPPPTTQPSLSPTKEPTLVSTTYPSFSLYFSPSTLPSDQPSV